MGIEDPVLAYKLDLALAARGKQNDIDENVKYVDAINTNVHHNAILIARAMGAKVKPQTKKQEIETDQDGVPTLKSVLAVHGGKGVKVKA